MAITVESIMAERGVGRRHAYTILRQMKTEELGDAPTNQRERILTLLYRSDGYIKDSRDLVEALQSEGYAIDGHDASKVLWSLQKTGHVKFRERQSPHFLYAIALTPRGRIDAKALMKPPATVEAGIPVAAEVVPESYIQPDLPPVTDQGAEASSVAHAMSVIENVRQLQQEINDLGAGPEVPIRAEDISPAEVEVMAAVPPWSEDMEGWPAFRDIRDRAVKASKLNAAAELLKEAGEEDMALALMIKTEFTELEEEVIAILKLFGQEV